MSAEGLVRIVCRGTAESPHAEEEIRRAAIFQGQRGPAVMMLGSLGDMTVLFDEEVWPADKPYGGDSLPPEDAVERHRYELECLVCPERNRLEVRQEKLYPLLLLVYETTPTRPISLGELRILLKDSATARASQGTGRN